MPRMSWHPRNLYNLWRRQLGGKVEDTVFTQTPKSLFQQRWAAKALLRAYHGDYINEKIFKRWYLPSTLPDVRSQAIGSAADAASLNKWAKREQAAEKEAKRLEDERTKGLAPVGSLMFREVERRIDVIVFRSCFAHSVYEARRLVVHGDIMLNGKKHTNPNTRLAPGDMISVNPEAIRFLQPDAAQNVTDADAVSEEGAQEDAPSAPAASEVDLEDLQEAEAGSTTAASESDAVPKRSSSKSSPPSSSKWKKGSGSNLTPFHLPSYASPFIFIPAYIEPSFSTCSAIYVRHPTARPGYSEIPTPYDADGEIVRAAWEWYTRVRPRMRSKSQLARMPENRQ
ncbi:uncharacterized protein FIBRA_03298 [Fibroporia radiculosa]|uniref:RNA-binding S4 domain-containing protein n=1 Tax=Fibroporia radiculosa TaxID=599839 RepID=J4H2B8_9APHY|nr:uncharacterized protein FIBRA_03298 [Fibroporia radiculosa]CCM01249.1 predicted protein [Fibroporia radiculosa]